MSQLEFFAGRKTPQPVTEQLSEGRFFSAFWSGGARNLTSTDLLLRARLPSIPWDLKHPLFLYETAFDLVRDYDVQGDDGVVWRVGSRGNDISIIRQEVFNNPILYTEEKREVLRCLEDTERDYPNVLPRLRNYACSLLANQVPWEDVKSLFQHAPKALLDQLYDGIITERIQNHQATVQEIEQSGLPAPVIENLLLNFHNYKQEKACRN